MKHIQKISIQHLGGKNILHDQYILGKHPKLSGHLSITCEKIIAILARIMKYIFGKTDFDLERISR